MKVLTCKALAERWNLDRKLVSRLIESGKGPGVKVGERYIVPLAWVERFEAGEDGPWSRAIAGLPDESLEVPEPEEDAEFNHFATLYDRNRIARRRLMR